MSWLDNKIPENAFDPQSIFLDRRQMLPLGDERDIVTRLGQSSTEIASDFARSENGKTNGSTLPVLRQGNAFAQRRVGIEHDHHPTLRIDLAQVLICQAGKRRTESLPISGRL